MSFFTAIKVYRRLMRPLLKGMPNDCQGQEASDLIKNYLNAESPCMIARFGSVEMDTILTNLMLNTRDPVKKLSIISRGGDFYWSRDIRKYASNNAGFFPAEAPYLSKFAEQYLAAAKNIDILGSWQLGEKHIQSHLKNAKIIRLRDIEPYYHANPWSESLKGKKVLVIHPFSESINSQFNTKREKIFTDQRILPDFELITLKAVQSIACTDTGFDTWFDALDWMCNEIRGINFDIAIIGAGAYGLPLAAYVKSIGKKAIHMGGATQVLFGIRGRAWDKRPFFQSFYNEHWVYPSQEEIPTNYKQIESGCYWR